MSTINTETVTESKLVQSHFVRPGSNQDEVFALKHWRERDVELRNSQGEIVFAQKAVEFPTDWSDDAIRIVASKYFKGPLDSPLRERSLKTLVRRVVNTFTQWGLEGGYFTQEESVIFCNELTWLVIDQRMAWNSPVWFNVGIPEIWQAKPGQPQCSACFINSVADTIDGPLGILSWFTREGIIFAMAPAPEHRSLNCVVVVNICHLGAGHPALFHL